MPNVTKTYTFTNGQTADATQVNQDLDTLYSLVNGGLDSVNLAANALNDTTKFGSEVITAPKTKGLPYGQDLFGQSFILTGGGVATIDGVTLSKLNVTALTAYMFQTDGSTRRVTANAQSFNTSAPSVTYYLDLNPDGSLSWALTHSAVSGYSTVATVTSDASSNILAVTDTRVLDPKMLSAPVQNVVGATLYAYKNIGGAL